MSDEWFHFQVDRDGAPEDGCDPREAEALKDYFAHKTTAKEAAWIISRPISEEPVITSVYNIGRLWGLLADAMMDLSLEKRTQSIELLREMEKLDLNGRFAHVWMDCFKPNQGWRERLQQDPSSREEYRAKFQKIAAIEAEMAQANIELTGAEWGLRCISDALESSETLFDVELPAVYEWVRIGGESIQAAIEAGEMIWDFEVPLNLYKAPKAPHFTPLTQDRVKFWIERLQTLTTQHDLDSNTRECARASAEIMKTWIPEEIPSSQAGA